MDYLLYLVVGAAAGMISGLFGLGGGVVIVPILIVVFTKAGLPLEHLTHMAIATSLATILVTASGSVWSHHLKGAVRWPLVAWMTPGIFLGVVGGSTFASQISGVVLQLAFGMFLCAVAAQLLFSSSITARHRSPSVVAAAGMGPVIGSLSALFGIGGGTITVPFLSQQGLRMPAAVATSAACGFPIALAGTLSYLLLGLQKQLDVADSWGYIYLPAWIGITVTSLPFARIAANIAHQLDEAKLKKLFALIALAMGIKFIFDNI